MPLPVLQPSLIGGELSPLLHGRVDLDRYRQALALCENFVVHPHGGVQNRPGTEYVGLTKLQNNSTVRLIPFQPTADTSFVIEVGHEYVRFFDQDGPVMTPSYLLLAGNDITPDDTWYGSGSTVYPMHHGQGFIGDAVNPFTIGMIGIKMKAATYGGYDNGHRVAIYTNSLPFNLPDVAVSGLDFDDFDSLADLGSSDLPRPNADGAWKYFKRKNPSGTVGSPAVANEFPAGTILHIVFKHEPLAIQPAVVVSLSASNTTNQYASGMMTIKQQTLGSVWTYVTGPPYNTDMCFAVYNNDQPEIVELVSPWTAGSQDDLGSESQISRLVFTQSVDVMTIVDPTGVTQPYELRNKDGSWELETIPQFVSVGAPSAVTKSVSVSQPLAAPTRKWQYAVSGVTVDGVEGLPTLSAVFDVGADISTLLPLTLLVTCGTEIVDHYAVYKGIGSDSGTFGTFGFIGTTKTPRTTADIAEAAYKAAYNTEYKEQLAAAGGRFRNQAQRQLAINAAIVAGQAARVAAAAAATVSIVPGTTQFVFQDENIAPTFTDQPRDGANPFAVADGLKPSSVTYFQQRLCFAGTPEKPDTIWMSESGDYRSFQRQIPAVADDSLEVTLAQGRLNEIRFMVPLRDLLVLTTGAEHLLTGGQNPVGPDNVDASPVSNFGCGTLHPLVVGNVILFKDIGGHVREWIYDQRSNAFPASDVGLLAEHLFKDEDGAPIKITEWAYVSAPQPVVYAIRADGVMLSFTYNRDQSVAAWARHTTSGKFKSIASTRTADSEGETVHLIVERVIDGTRTLTIEKFDTRNERTSPFSDCAVVTALDSQYVNGDNDPNWEFKLGTINGWSIDTAAELVAGATVEIRVPKLKLAGSLLVIPEYPDFAATEPRWIILHDGDGGRFTMRVLSVWPGVGNEDIYQVVLDSDITAALSLAPEGAYWEFGTTTFTGFSHLIGETVTVRADDGHHADIVVSSDTIVLDYVANRVAAGLLFESTIKTLAMAGFRSDVKSKQKLISEVAIDVYNTSGLKAGIDEDNLTEFSVNTLYDPTSRANGRITVRTSNKWERNGQVVVRQSKPLPATILAISPEVDVGG